MASRLIRIPGQVRHRTLQVRRRVLPARRLRGVRPGLVRPSHVRIRCGYYFNCNLFRDVPRGYHFNCNLFRDVPGQRYDTVAINKLIVRYPMGTAAAA